MQCTIGFKERAYRLHQSCRGREREREFRLLSQQTHTHIHRDIGLRLRARALYTNSKPPPTMAFIVALITCSLTNSQVFLGGNSFIDKLLIAFYKCNVQLFFHASFFPHFYYFIFLFNYSKFITINYFKFLSYIQNLFRQPQELANLVIPLLQPEYIILKLKSNFKNSTNGNHKLFILP